jgi:4-hydroxy-L-threonine phosphate dehydrogenase PdxA
MKNKPILIVAGEPNSIFFEIFFKSLKRKKFLSPLILISNFNLFKQQIKKFNYKGKYKIINNVNSLDNKLINIIDVKIKKNNSRKIQLNNNNEYIISCFKIALKILKNKITNKFLNGPINKKKFLKGKYLGITEYISKNLSKEDNIGMLIYNKKLSVSPLTTHLPVKLITKKISKKLIKNRLKIINNFYLKNFRIKPKIAVAGLNPHCESIFKYNEDEKILTPAIKYSKSCGILAFGPYSADTIFLKQNRNKFNVILGMYHDQVLAPFKTIFEYDAINITMGLPFLRVSPDHGPNEKMINKNLSNPLSLIRALEFLDNK